MKRRRDAREKNPPTKVRSAVPSRAVRILVTAGPTRERIDAVRWITNASSGKMGYALAAAARSHGHSVTLVSGPCALDCPNGVERVFVESAIDMKRAVDARFRSCDIVLMAAAVADYRPRRAHRGKIKKTAETLTLELVRNPDILAGLGKKKKGQVLVGFALETKNLLHSAKEKLERKRLDLIVANGPENLDSGRATVTIVAKDGSKEKLVGDKSEVAAAVVARALTLFFGRPTGD